MTAIMLIVAVLLFGGQFAYGRTQRRVDDVDPTDYVDLDTVCDDISCDDCSADGSTATEDVS